MVLSNPAAANIRGKQSVLFKVNESGTTDLLRNGSLGQIEGFMIHQSGQIVKITPGAGSLYVTNGSTAPGVTSIAMLTGSGNVNAGDVVTFAADANNKYVIGTGLTGPGTLVLNNPGAIVTSQPATP